MGQIKAEGDFLRNLQKAPRSWVVIVGTLLICLPPLLACVAVIAVLCADNGPITVQGTAKEYAELALAVLGLLVFFGFYFFVFGKIAWRSMRNQFAQRKAP